MTCGARLPMRPSLPDRSRQPAPSVKTPQEKSVHLPSVSSTSPALLGATAHSQHLYNQLLPHSFLCNGGGALFLFTRPVFSATSTLLLLPYAFPAHSRALPLQISAHGPSPDFVGAPLRYLFPFFSRVGDCGYESPASPVPAFFSPLFNFKPSIGDPDPIGTVNLFLCPLV